MEALANSPASPKGFILSMFRDKKNSRLCHQFSGRIVLLIVIVTSHIVLPNIEGPHGEPKDSTQGCRC